MLTAAAVTGLYTQLLQISDEAFTGGCYTIAYHALTAAMHCAEATHDSARLDEVAAVAETQGIWLNTHDPHHRLSQQSASRRGNRGVYGSLTLQIEGLQARMRSAPEEARGGNDPVDCS